MILTLTVVDDMLAIRVSTLIHSEIIESTVGRNQCSFSSSRFSMYRDKRGAASIVAHDNSSKDILESSSLE